MGKTSIEWCDFSTNPIRARDKKTGKIGHFCEKISAGCKNCYASRMQRRFGMHEFTATNRDNVELFLDEHVLRQVIHRKKPTRYFWCDMSDIFYDGIPDEWIDACFATIAFTRRHTHMVLTKRPERMVSYLAGLSRCYDRLESKARQLGCTLRFNDIPLTPWPIPSVWLGTSVENQQAANERIPHLLQCPAAVRFLSVEPLLGPIELSDVTKRVDAVSQLGKKSMNGIDWVIVGGESGPHARPCNVEWIRSVVQQCQQAEVPCFVKQVGSVPLCVFDSPDSGVNGFDTADFGDAGNGLVRPFLGDRKGGDMEEWPEDLQVRQFPAI